MTMMVKDPDACVDFEFDWSAACPGGRAIAASEWNVTPGEADGEIGGVTVAAASHGLAHAIVTLAGGVVGRAYRVTNRVTMTDGQIDERSMVMRVEER